MWTVSQFKRIKTQPNSTQTNRFCSTVSRNSGLHSVSTYFLPSTPDLTYFGFGPEDTLQMHFWQWALTCAFQSLHYSASCPSLSLLATLFSPPPPSCSSPTSLATCFESFLVEFFPFLRIISITVFQGLVLLPGALRAVTGTPIPVTLTKRFPDTWVSKSSWTCLGSMWATCKCSTLKPPPLCSPPHWEVPSPIQASERGNRSCPKRLLPHSAPRSPATDHPIISLGSYFFPPFPWPMSWFKLSLLCAWIPMTTVKLVSPWWGLLPKPPFVIIRHIRLKHRSDHSLLCLKTSADSLTLWG